MNEWLEIARGDVPLIVSFPHTGTDIPDDYSTALTSHWLARKDADHWVDQLYDFARELGATTLRTRISRTVIDVNRDPSGASLYPGQNTTELCPTTTFDGEPLYHGGREPSAQDIASRRERFFAPYHAALEAELARLRGDHARIVLFDAHAIRSQVPRLFEGVLPELNLGTNDGRSCSTELQVKLVQLCAASGRSYVCNGRFKGGWTTRQYGEPRRGVQAVQLELACRSYMLEPDAPLSAANWPSPYEPERARALRSVLRELLSACRGV
jgi:formiminoglutamase